MKIVLTMEEVLKVLYNHLQECGLHPKKDTGKSVSHIEGSYEDQQQVIEGFSFEIEEKY